jgi:hypothetical protein
MHQTIYRKHAHLNPLLSFLAEYFYNYYPLNAIKVMLLQAKEANEIHDVAICIMHSNDTLTSYYSAWESDTCPHNKISIVAYDILP